MTAQAHFEDSCPHVIRFTMLVVWGWMGVSNLR